MKKIAIILSGCGHLDGSEIREAVLTFLYLDIAGAEIEIFSPDRMQHHVINHKTGLEEKPESRNILAESARIARGKISPLGDLKVSQFDSLILPGGYGAAKNLSDFAFSGKDTKVDEELSRVIKEFHNGKKPIGAICISPAILAAVIAGEGKTPKVTIGDDEATSEIIKSFGGEHQNCGTRDFIFDNDNLLVTCSAYMREDKISDVAIGIEKLVNKIMEIC